MVMHRFLVA
jgi:chaperonin GroES